jgi:hypothetical protein
MKVGDIVFSKSSGKPFRVLDVRLAKDYPGDPEATHDLIQVQRADPENISQKWDRERTALWPADWVHTGQLKMEFINE